MEPQGADASNHQSPRQVDEAEIHRLAKERLWPGKTDAEIAQEAHEYHQMLLGACLETLAATNGVTVTPRSVPSEPSAGRTQEALTKFLSLKSSDFYSCYLRKSFPPLKLDSTSYEIQVFIDKQCGKKGISAGGRAAYFRAMRSFFNWCYSPASGLGLNLSDNPIKWVKAPKPDDRIMPAQDEKTFGVLLFHVENTRDRAVLSLLIDSGGRLSEVSNINEVDILWDKHLIRAIAKGGREVLMPFGKASEILIRDWLTEFHPNGVSIWGINKSGIVSMLRRLERKTGIKCNAHTFRRGFASILRRRGVDSLDIMKLGHWKSLAMVQLYTESVSFEDSLSHYEAPTERPADATGGLRNNVKVPRPRIELGTRGFSVRCSTY